MKLEDIKKIADTAAGLLATISPHIAAAVKAGAIAIDVYEDYEASRAEIAGLLAQDKVTKAQIDALDDSIQARSKRIQEKAKA